MCLFRFVVVCDGVHVEIGCGGVRAQELWGSVDAMWLKCFQFLYPE